MLHRISISVDNPELVAQVLCQLVNGSILPNSNSELDFTVLLNDEYGSAIDLISRSERAMGTTNCKSSYSSNISEFSPTHLAISIPVSKNKIEEITKKEGWHMAVGNRGRFELIELWIENKFLLELILVKNLSKYVNSMNKIEFIILAFVMNAIRTFKKTFLNA